MDKRFWLKGANDFFKWIFSIFSFTFFIMNHHKCLSEVIRDIHGNFCIYADPPPHKNKLPLSRVKISQSRLSTNPQLVIIRFPKKKNSHCF